MWESFDKVYCLTLEKDKQRQNHAKNELRRVGLDFEFFYGLTPESETIKNLYRHDRVAKYPTCFRCKKAKCKCPNNFLIPSQVACFKSFLNLFSIAAKTDHHTFLVVEDDVEFETYYAQLAKIALNRDRLHKILFFSEFPCLLSMGQNYGNRSPKSKRIFKGHHIWSMDDTSECNVTFGFNKPFAKLALKMCPKVAWTSDTYIHRFVGNNCLHFSLFPRISHDLSWSTGKLKSHIHPKKLYFTQNHSLDDKRTEIKRYQSHIQRVESKQEYDKYIEKYLST